MTGTRGRAFIYEWNRNRQRRMDEGLKKKKALDEEARKLRRPRKHNN